MFIDEGISTVVVLCYLLLLLTSFTTSATISTKKSWEVIVKNLQKKQLNHLSSLPFSDYDSQLVVSTRFRQRSITKKVFSFVQRWSEKLVFRHLPEDSTYSYSTLTTYPAHSSFNRIDFTASSSSLYVPRSSLFPRNPFRKPLKEVLSPSINLISRRLSSFLRYPFCSLPKQKILILMSDTGGGHRSSAQALDEAIKKQFGKSKFDIKILDIWTNHSKWPFNQCVPFYQFLAKYPILWKGMYFYGTFPPTKKLTEVLAWRSSYPLFRTAIEEVKPDCVVSVHPLCQYMPLSIVETLNKQRMLEGKPLIPFVTVVTDLGGAHRCWFDNRVDAIFVPSEAVERLAWQYGVEKDKIIVKVRESCDIRFVYSFFILFSYLWNILSFYDVF
jgi:hypothetical protein